MLGLGASLMAQEPSGQKLAERLDEVRRPGRSFEVRLTLTEIRDGKVSKTSEHRIVARKHPDREDYDTVALALAPEEDKGKVVLTRGIEVWLYDPKSSRPVKISPRQFRGKFFVADALSTSFALSYTSENAGTETILDASRKERACHHLRMKLRQTGGLIPEAIDYWVDRSTLLPVKGEFHNGSGKLLRTAYYMDAQRILGEPRPMRILVVSGTERGLVTDVRFQQIQVRETPEGIYAPEHLPAFSRGELPGKE